VPNFFSAWIDNRLLAGQCYHVGWHQDDRGRILIRADFLNQLHAAQFQSQGIGRDDF
jgi:hypothetical protein